MTLVNSENQGDWQLLKSIGLRRRMLLLNHAQYLETADEIGC